MWCTRWYLPLLLLPFPTAPVYFLGLFVFVLTVHSQPCFYCISLIVTFFISSCYWQPLPLSAPLAAPWSENVTTFGDALLLILPNYMAINSRTHNLTHPTVLSNDTSANHTAQKEPELRVPLVERGWCHFSLGQSVFEPFNTTRWEVASVEALKDDLERREKEALALTQPEAEETATNTEEPPAAPADVMAVDKEGMAQEAVAAKRGWMDLFMFTPLMRNWASPELAPLPEPEPLPEPRSSPPPHITPVPVTEPAEPAPHNIEKVRKSLPWFRREYSLKPYGIDAVIDFGWSRTA